MRLRSERTMSPIIQAIDVVKRYPGLTAVNQVSFTIDKGECVGLLGPNGAGKSTMISMIYGAIKRSAGQMIVLGGDPERDGRAIKRALGVVPQENALDELMNVEDNMLMFASLKGIPKGRRRADVSALLEFMNLGHKAKQPIRSLSGGMQRRLAFVRALLGRPELLILDEPTTGLDPAVRHLLWQKVEELKQQGTTILLTTHYMDEAEILCDRLLIMDRGQIAAEGAPRQLIAHHCPGYVAHFHRRPGGLEALRRIASQDPHLLASEHSTGLALRGPTLEALSRQLPPDWQPTMIRPANLEDVFLKISGRELSEDA